MLRHWSQLVPNMSADIRGHKHHFIKTFLYSPGSSKHAQASFQRLNAARFRRRWTTGTAGIGHRLVVYPYPGFAGYPVAAWDLVVSHDLPLSLAGLRLALLGSCGLQPWRRERQSEREKRERERFCLLVCALSPVNHKGLH